MVIGTLGIFRVVSIALTGRRLLAIGSSPLAPTSASIPSTVKDHWLLATRSNTRFHPLKAGRRPLDRIEGMLKSFSFHPLKAGRRRVTPTLLSQTRSKVSIPSRRVGDSASRLDCRPIYRVSIPSRRVGDRCPGVLAGKTNPCFHPLKAGRRLAQFLLSTSNEDAVSIPSRRVGDSSR